ncbi:serine/threonine protein kinase, partial [Streptomyces kunmingensis]|nr:serine/threonine protein kinase [Streptomyces kunmingensis]
AAGAPRPGSARNRHPARRRRITLGVAGLVLAVALGGGIWAMTSSGGEERPPSDGNNSAPAAP